MSFSEVKLFTIEFLEITGQKVAICPSRSKYIFFCTAVSLLASGTEVLSLLRPLCELEAVFLCPVASRKGTKFLLRQIVYMRFCLQVSYDLIDSLGKLALSFSFRALGATAMLMSYGCLCKDYRRAKDFPPWWQENSN